MVGFSDMVIAEVVIEVSVFRGTGYETLEGMYYEADGHWE